MSRPAWIFATVVALAMPQAVSGANNQSCGVAHLAQCRDTNALVADGDFERALMRFLGTFGLSRISLLQNNAVLIDQIIEVVHGPPDAPTRLPSGGYLFTACRAHSCDEKGAVAFDSSGRLIAIGVLNFRCSLKCDSNPTLDIFIRQQYPAAEEARRAIRRWSQKSAQGGTALGYPRALGIEQLHVLDALEAPNNDGAIPVTLDQLHRYPAVYAGKNVRVSGQLDECWLAQACSVCPVEATVDNQMRPLCVAIDWDKMLGAMGDRFRYADVTVVASFDPTCWAKNTFCENAIALKGARLERAGTPRYSSRGLIHERQILRDPPADIARSVVELGTVSMSEGNRQGAEFRAFAMADDPAATSQAILCIARSAGDPPIWPDTEVGALFAPSATDRYSCKELHKVKGQWLVDLR